MDVTLQAERSDDGQRLDRVLAGRVVPAITRSQAQRLIAAGAVRLNAQSNLKPHTTVRAGDCIELRIDDPRDPAPTLVAEPIPLAIVFEDASLMVVNKPAGLVTHPAPGHWRGTLVNGLLWHLGQAVGSGFGVEGTDPQPQAPGAAIALPRAGLVHRLDKDTSGLLVVAKTAQAHAALSAQLKRRRMRRSYVAVVEGEVNLDEGTISEPIGRHVRDRQRMAVRLSGGRDAVTHYAVMFRGAQEGPQTGRRRTWSVLCCRLETGRTHQIRVHLAHLGHPVIGDPTYGRRAWPGVARHLLHAFRLEFEHPANDDRCVFEVAPPSEFAPFLAPGTLLESPGASVV